MAARLGAPKRSPWPFDITIDTGDGPVGLMLGTSSRKDAQLVASKPPGMENVAPSDYSYSAEDPSVEKMQTYKDFGLGFGLRSQSSSQDQRYYYTLNADASPGSVVVKGPELVTVLPSTVDHVNGVSGFFEIGNRLYALNGRYCLRREGDSSWSVSKDFGSGKKATDAVTFYPNLDGATEHAYVGMGDSEAIWKFDGTTWTQRVKVQTFTLTGATGGSFTLTYKAVTTGALVYNISAELAQAAIRALHADLATCDVTKASTTWTVTHTGKGTAGANDGDLTYSSTTSAYTGTDEERLTSSATNLTGSTPTITHYTTQIAIFARAWLMVGRELYRAHDLNYLAKVDADSDPFQERNWSASSAFRIGDHSEGIQRLIVTADGVLLAIKNDGVYTLNEYGEDQRFFPYLQMAERAGTYDWLESLGSYTALEALTYDQLEAGLDFQPAVAGYLNDVHVSYGASTFRMGVDYSLEQIGPELMAANDSEVHGIVTAMAAHQTFCLYAGLYNPDNGCSYVLKYGAWLGSESGEMTGQAKRVESWHGSITPAFNGKRILAMYVTSNGAAGSHQRLYMGFSDGSITCFGLPCAASPLACLDYRYSIEDGRLYLPIADMGFGSDVKLLHGYTVAAFGCDASSWIEMEYREDLAGEWHAFPEHFCEDSEIREKVPFNEDVTAAFLEQAVVLRNTSRASSPQLSGLGVHWSLRANIEPDVYEIIQFRVLAAGGLVKRDGSPFRLGPEYIKETVQAANKAATVELILPDETMIRFKLTGYNKVLAWDARIEKLRSAYQVTGVRQKEQQIYGTYNRLEELSSYENLESLTYETLEVL